VTYWAEARIPGEDLPAPVFGDDREVVAFGDAVFREDGIVDAMAERAQVLDAAAPIDVDAHKGHGTPNNLS
jgi:hypothetical protein